MIDLLYPLGNGSRLKDFELRMSLRSMERHLKGFDKVWIVGQKPEWLQNVNFIPMKDDKNSPDYNIMAKIARACEEKELSETFGFFNDDHFLLHDFDIKTFPYYYEGTLEQYANRKDAYGSRARNSLNHLKTKGLPTKNFDIHTPILYNKEQFLKNIVPLEWINGYIIKSLYANILKIEGVEIKDNKINQPPNPGDSFFSTPPYMRASVTRFLSEMFPEKSRFEK